MLGSRDRGGSKPATGRVVAVTGAAGRVGSACLRALADRGDAVIAVDRRLGSEPATWWRRADLRHARPSRRAMDGATHLIHLAASATVPDARRPNAVLLGNVSIAANVLEAFVAGNGTTAVVASSASAYGLAWAREVRSPAYVPVDENHPCLPEDTYGLSKVVTEQLGAMWSRSAGITSVMLRFPWTAADEESTRIRSYITRLAEEPGCELARRHLWSYVHVDDLADAFVRGLELDDRRAHVLNVASPEVPGGHALSSLVSQWFQAVEQRPDLDATGAFSCVRARNLLGWTPSRTLGP